MAFTVTTRTSQQSTAVTSHPVLLPDGSNVSGKRVVVWFAAEAAVTWPAGWSERFAGSTTATVLRVAERIIDGTEGFDGVDDSITVTTASGTLSNAHAYLLSGSHASTASESATAATGTGANVNPPSVNPAGWDVEESLFIAGGAYRFNASFTAPPTDYTDVLSLSGGDSNAPLGTARRVLSAASDDPGTFTSSDGGAWVSTTVVVRPSGSVATNLVIQDATQAHTADSLALTQTHSLTIADATQGQSSDLVALTQQHQIVIAEATQAHTADNLTLTAGAVNLVIQDAIHDHTADQGDLEAVIPTFTFIPPTVGGMPTSIESKRDTDPAHRLWSYYDRWAMGQTVWKDQAGVWHAETWPEQGGDTTTIHEGDTTTVTAPREGLATAQVVYLGGHVYEITEAEAAELTAAGFGANIT